MKTSNYILISFFVFLFGGVFVFFLTSKYHKEEVSNWQYFSHPLQNFSVIVAEQGARFQVEFGETTSLLICYKSPDKPDCLNSFVRNDTLFMFPYEGKIKSMQYQNVIGVRKAESRNMIVHAKQIKNIISKEKSEIDIYKIPSDSININVDGGKISCFYKETEKQAGILNITATRKGFVLIGGSIIAPNIKFKLNQSKLDLQYSTVQSITGSLENHSRLISYRTINNLNLVADSTSTYDLEKQVFITISNEFGEKREQISKKSY